jgi:hypothetical protein
LTSFERELLRALGEEPRWHTVSEIVQAIDAPSWLQVDSTFRRLMKRDLVARRSPFSQQPTFSLTTLGRAELAAGEQLALDDRRGLAAVRRAGER